jgi:LemA protein
MLNSPLRVPSTRRGALSAGIVVLIVVLVLALVVGGMAVSKYNALAGGKTVVAAKFAAIDNQYKRRADLIPQLVETVKGAANFEKSTLEAVVEARASVSRVQLPPDLPDDPAKVQAYVAAQQSLSGALTRLMVVAEQYPDLKANASFRDLQSQLEGTENRIAVARNDYIDSVQSYNRSLVTFPGNIVGGIFNFKEMPQLAAATEEERKVPKVEFDSFDKSKEKK